MNKEVEVRSKIWLEVDSEVVFGFGRLLLFEAIQETGSINQAAAKLEMSYRAAWGKVTATEQRMGIPLVVKSPGNRKKGTILTPEGQELLRRYRIFQREAQAAVDESFRTHIQSFVIEQQAKNAEAK